MKHIIKKIIRVALFAFLSLVSVALTPAYAGTEEVSLYSMSTWSSTYNEGIGWNASYNNSTKTITFDADETEGHEGYWQRIGWNFLWKYIDAGYQSFTIEFASPTPTNGQVQVTYFDNDASKNKYFDYASGVTSVTCDLQTGFEDADESGAYNLKYINIGQVQGTTLELSKVYFTTTGNSDVYQAENADFAGYIENFTEADNSVVRVEDATADDHVTFTVNAPCKAVYRLNIGYNNGTSNNDRACNLKINDGSDIGITLPMTGDEGNKSIGEVAYSTILNKGDNTIKIYGNWRWYNIDYLRVYEPTLYLVGNVHESGYSWAPNSGKQMTFDSEAETFSCTTRIGMSDNQATAGTFAFATTLASDASGWSYMNGHRWAPSTDEFAVDPDGKTATTDIIKQGWNSYKVPMAGTYTITMKADLSSFTIQGPAVYMFGKFEGSGYTWATDKYTMMTYDATNEVYRLRTRIADAAATSGDGEVAFATAYSDAADSWTYLNANRYGPSSDADAAVDNSANTIARNGDTKFTGIPAHKYEVVVDMFSATKTAKFYPLYTFGYEVEGTNAHGSIACSTDDSEIPNGTSVTVTATPDAGYRFVKWTDDSDTQLSTSATYSPTISANTWLKAWFEPDPSCLLGIAATDFAFAKHNDDIYTAADNSFLYQEDGAMYFNYTYNDGSELFYPVHLDAGTYYFYCTLSADGAERKLRLYAQDEDGTLLYSGKKWSMDDSDDFGSGAATFETKGFTVTAGDYLIALYAKQNTKFSQINVVGVCNGATTDTYALTLSAGSNGSVISDQVNNSKIISGTEMLLLAVPSSGYRFYQWSDGSTDNPRTVTMSGNLSLTASFNQTNGCLNTVVRECESASITPTTAPVAVTTTTSTSSGLITNKEAERMLYYAFEITEPATCSFTLLTPTSNKQQALYLYSAQLTSGTSLVYDGTTYYQSGDPTDANSPNSGTNHVYPVCSRTVALAAGKYVVGVYSEYSWSVYDKLVLSAGGTDIDCSLADITIEAGDEVALPHVVNNLTVHQGGVATNTHDVEILNSITYIRPAYGGANDNKMNQWYPFCLPFAPKSQESGGCQVYDEEDGRWYNINPIYLTGGDAANNPSGKGYFYLKYLTNDYTGVQPDEFRNRWAYIGQNMPEQYVPYIILFVNHWEDDNTDDDYFVQNPVVKFTGGAQTIEGAAKVDRLPAEGVESYFYYANNTLAPIHLDDAYVFSEEDNHFNYQEDVTIAPFECYIQATESFKAKHSSVAMPRVGSSIDTATAVDEVQAAAGVTFVYDITGRLLETAENDTTITRLPAGVYVCKRGNETYKLIIR